MAGLSEIGAQGGVRFQFVNAIPVTAMVAFTGAVTATGAFSAPASASALRRAVAAVAVRELVVGAFAVLLLAILANSFQQRAVKLLEGYWRPVGVRMLLLDRNLTRHWQRRTYFGILRTEDVLPSWWEKRIRARLSDRFAHRILEDQRQWAGGVADRYPQVTAGSDVGQQLCFDFGAGWSAIEAPDDDRIMPTRLGNALRFGEDVAGDRFGLPAVDFMPYLLSVASDDARAQYEDTRTELDVTVRFVYVWLYCTALSGIAFLNDGLWMLVPLVTFVLAWVSYEAAVIAATSLGEVLSMIVTLFRFDLLRRLAWPLPQSAADERPLFESLRLLIEDGSVEVGNAVPYVHTSQ